MKTMIISMLLVFMLSISITGCSSSKNRLNSGNNSSTSGTSSTSETSDTSSTGGTNSTSSNKTSDTSVPTSPSPTSSDSKSENTKTQILSNNSVLEAYKAVLQNKAEFFSTDNKKKLYLNHFLTNKEIYGTAFKVTRFSVLDMDGDKVPDVILELSVGNEPEFYEVLHIIKGAVYGYLLPYRALEKLKGDGTFRFSSGAADSGWGKLSFETNALKTDILAQSKSEQGGTNLTISYFINNKPVTKESFDSFAKEQSEKKDAVWYEFSQMNIETKLPSSQ